MGAEFCVDWWTDGQMDRTKVIVVFRNFANVPKKEYNNGGTV